MPQKTEQLQQPPVKVKRRKLNRSKFRYLEPVLVSVPEFGRLSGLGDSLTRQLVKSGELPSRRIGTRIWIIRDEAIAWLRKQVA